MGYIYGPGLGKICGKIGQIGNTHLIQIHITTTAMFLTSASAVSAGRFPGLEMD